MGWNLSRVVEDATKEKYRGQLCRKYKQVMITTLASDKLTVGIVQMEILSQIHWRGPGYIPAVIGTLLSSDKFDGHGENGGICPLRKRTFMQWWLTEK